MNFAIDMVILLIGVFLVIWSTVRGFVKSVMGFARLGLAVMLSYLLTPLFSFWKINIFVKYLLVFVVMFGLLVLLTFLIDKLCEKPVLKELNRLLGFLFGLASAYIMMSVVATLITGMFAYETIGNAFGISQAEFEAQTYIYRFFNHYGVFSFVKLTV